VESETDSDGDGGSKAKLRGIGHIEFSLKGIPHGILHFVEQIQLGGHIFFHDVTASEGAHRLYVKKVMTRVRKGTDYATSSWSIQWVFCVRTWAKIIDSVVTLTAGRQRKEVESLTVFVNRTKRLSPTDDFRVGVGQQTFSPLRSGGDRLLCNDVRLSYNELGHLVSSFTGWDLDYVKDVVQVQLYCSAERCGPGKERRTYWATEEKYNYNGGSRRDMVEVVWLHQGVRKTSCAQITGFITMYGDVDRASEGVIIRWMNNSSLSAQPDNRDRPICEYPLGFNHCLWEWSKTDTDRPCFTVRGFRNRVRRAHLWSHVKELDREESIRSEIRAYYDIVPYDSIVCHSNIHKDPSTGHMLQTLQII